MHTDGGEYATAEPAITFPAPTADWGTVVHAALFYPDPHWRWWKPWRWAWRERRFWRARTLMIDVPVTPVDLSGRQPGAAPPDIDEPLYWRLRWWLVVAAVELVGMGWLVSLWVR